MRILNCAVQMPAEIDMAIDALLPAAQATLAGAGLAATDIDMIVTISVSPDHRRSTPASSARASATRCKRPRVPSTPTCST
ncbi:hypothetical protein [Massilia sp. Se16.2.3]|uniref:hypothetical protein n=1 Tax=Massilia sp. Se16.2.3 TaxID=2709303 RepID=UPI0015FFAB0B|nr:hypothetical protein [Massilia sp. Se16.2.3]QNA98234.1 hypothetical protein G4G31_04265 [Massilia sp. Se16.2.3]